jgi:hypothetical protein
MRLSAVRLLAELCRFRARSIGVGALAECFQDIRQIGQRVDELGTVTSAPAVASSRYNRVTFGVYPMPGVLDGALAPKLPALEDPSAT